MDIGLATSEPPVDHDPGAGAYLGSGRLGRGRTILTPVILRSLFSPWNGKGGGVGSGSALPSPERLEAPTEPTDSNVPAWRNFRRSMSGPPIFRDATENLKRSGLYHERLSRALWGSVLICTNPAYGGQCLRQRQGFPH